jgi:hypothetical protein
LKEVGAEWAITDNKAIVAKGTLEQLGRAEGAFRGWGYLRKE